jgi:hypothetical protein
MDFRNANGFVGYVNRPQNTIVAFDLHGQTASKFMTLVNETNDEVAHRIYEFRKEQGYE